MTLEQLRAFAASDPRGPYPLKALTPELARKLVEDHERILRHELAERELFEAPVLDLTAHVERQNSKGDVRQEFARQIERSVL